MYLLDNVRMGKVRIVHKRRIYSWLPLGLHTKNIAALISSKNIHQERNSKNLGNQK